MSHPLISYSAIELCQHMMSDPSADTLQQSMAKQLLSLVESVCSDSKNDPFYESFIRYLAMDISGKAL